MSKLGYFIERRSISYSQSKFYFLRINDCQVMKIITLVSFFAAILARSEGMSNLRLVYRHFHLLNTTRIEPYVTLPCFCILAILHPFLSPQISSSKLEMMNTPQTHRISYFSMVS